MQGVYINNHEISDGKHIKTAFIDSGTTFTYVPRTIYSIFLNTLTGSVMKPILLIIVKGNFWKIRKTRSAFRTQRRNFQMDLMSIS